MSHAIHAYTVTGSPTAVLGTVGRPVQTQPPSSLLRMLRPLCPYTSL
jgi:hypothetical protein